MVKKVDRQLLVQCLKLPCQWQNEGNVKTCPYLRRPAGSERGFPKGVCQLYSTPGPHAESAIATVLGVSVSVIRREQEKGMKKLSVRLAGDMSMSHDEKYMQLMEAHFGR
jgi:hypothetical protein